MRLQTSLLGLLFAVTAASGVPVTLRWHWASIAAGRIIPGSWPAERSWVNQGGVRILDVAVGPRIGDRLSVMPWLVVGEDIWGYAWTTEDFSVYTTAGLLATWNATPARQPRDLMLAAGFRVCPGWSIWWGGDRFVDAMVSVGKTVWVVNPSLDVGWRYEFRPDGTAPPISTPHGRFWAVLRVGLGGTYELGRR